MVVGLAVGLVGLVGCRTGSATTPSGSGTTDRTTRYGGTVVVGVPDDSTGWMPATDRWSPGAITMARSFLDPLVVIGADGGIHPWLAESFTPEDGARSWTIAIRPGISFTNGEPVDSHAVVYNLQTLRTSPLTTFAFTPITDIAKVDDLRLRVTLDQEWANFPALFAGQPGYIVAPEQLRKGDSQHPIGSGPFVFHSWTRDAELVAKRNPAYWRTDPEGRKLPYLDEVVFRPIADEASRRSAVDAGDLDVMTTNSASGVASMLRGNVPEGTRIMVDDSQGDEMAVVLNTQSGPTADVRVRRALQLGTDRAAILDRYSDAYEAADGPFTRDSPWWSDSGQPELDVDAAVAILAEYRADHPGPIGIDLVVPASPDGLELGQMLQSQWAAIGVDVSLAAEDAPTISGTLIGGRFSAVAFAYWNGEDPDINYHFWSSATAAPEGGIAINFTRWANPEVDRALDVGRAETDPARRREQYGIVWRNWTEHAVYIWLYHATWLVLARERIEGIGDVNLPDGTGMAQPIAWGTVNLSNTWRR